MWQKLIALTLIFAFGAFGARVWAAELVNSATNEKVEVDSTIKIEDSEGLRLQLIQNTQDPGSKEVKFDLIMTSQIDSDRLQVRWDVGGVSEVVQGPETVQLSVEQGRTYTVSLVIRPRGFGTSNIKAFVEAFQIDGTRVATAAQTIGFQADGEAFPPTENQALAKTLYTVRQIGLIIGGILVIVVLLTLGRSMFLRWLNDRNS